VIKKLFYSLALTMSLIASLTLCFAIPVWAVSNPDSISLETIYVFQNIFEDGDILFVSSEDVEYGAPPSEDAKNTFNFSIYNSDNSTLIRAIGLNAYNYGIQSIYFSATQVSGNITWGDSYVTRVNGNPIFFAQIENVTMSSNSLSPGEWIEGTMTDSRALLRTHCIDLAETLETEHAETYVVQTPDKKVLNSAGRTLFLNAINNLDYAIPDLFEFVSGTMYVDHTTGNATLPKEHTIAKKLGTSLETAFNGIGNYFGTSGKMVAGIWMWFFIAIVSSIVFLNSGNAIASILLSIPIVILGVFVGVIPMAALFTIGILITVYAVYHLYLRGV